MWSAFSDRGSLPLSVGTQAETSVTRDIRDAGASTNVKMALTLAPASPAIVAKGSEHGDVSNSVRPCLHGECSACNDCNDTCQPMGARPSNHDPTTSLSIDRIRPTVGSHARRSYEPQRTRLGNRAEHVHVLEMYLYLAHVNVFGKEYPTCVSLTRGRPTCIILACKVPRVATIGVAVLS